MKAYPVTHVGLVRPQNEDSIRVVKGACGLYMLADGMGGHLAGEVASRMTCDVLEETLRDCLVPTASKLQSAIERANSAVFEKQKNTPEMNISIPISIRIIPPAISALPANFVPNFLPIITPARQITKVTAIIKHTATSAVKKLYSAIVKPTDKASIEVATA